MVTTGIILAGGKSLRMGQEKGLMLLNGKPLIGYALDAMAPLVSEIIIVAHDQAYYQFGHKVVGDLIPNSGPLGGIYSGLMSSQTDVNLVLSCDTPFVKTEFLAFLLSRLGEYPAVVPAHEGRVEPLVGVYQKQCIPKIASLIAGHDLKMRWAIKQLNAREVSLDEAQDFYQQGLFDNINTMEALMAAEQRLAAI